MAAYDPEEDGMNTHDYGTKGLGVFLAAIAGIIFLAGLSIGVAVGSILL